MRKSPERTKSETSSVKKRQPLFRSPKYLPLKRALTKPHQRCQDNPDEKKTLLKSGPQAVQLEIKSDPAPYRRGKRPASVGRSDPRRRKTNNWYIPNGAAPVRQSPADVRPERQKTADNTGSPPTAPCFVCWIAGSHPALRYPP